MVQTAPHEDYEWCARMADQNLEGRVDAGQAAQVQAILAIAHAIADLAQAVRHLKAHD